MGPECTQTRGKFDPADCKHCVNDTPAGPAQLAAHSTARYTSRPPMQAGNGQDGAA